MSKLEDDRAKLARVLDCRPSTLDHWFDLLGLLDEAGALGSQLAAIGAAVEMKRGNRLAGQSLNRLFLELASQSEESGDWWVVSQPGKKTVPALVFEPPKIDLKGRRSL